MSAVLADSLSIHSFFFVTWRKIRIFAALCAAWTLLFLAIAPSSFADKKVPQDEYKAALENSYAAVFADADVSDKQVSSFVSCLSEATYNDLSAATIQALASGNMNYEINSDEAGIFLDAVETCLADNDLSDVVVAPESEGGDAGDGDVSTVGTSGAGLTETSTKGSPSYLLPLATGLTLLAIITFALYLLIRGKSRGAHEANNVSAENAD